MRAPFFRGFFAGVTTMSLPPYGRVMDGSYDFYGCVAALRISDRQVIVASSETDVRDDDEADLAGSVGLAMREMGGSWEPLPRGGVNGHVYQLRGLEEFYASAEPG